MSHRSKLACTSFGLPTSLSTPPSFERPTRPTRFLCQTRKASTPCRPHHPSTPSNARRASSISSSPLRSTRTYGQTRASSISSEKTVSKTYLTSCSLEHVSKTLCGSMARGPVSFMSQGRRRYRLRPHRDARHPMVHVRSSSICCTRRLLRGESDFPWRQSRGGGRSWRLRVRGIRHWKQVRCLSSENWQLG